MTSHSGQPSFLPSVGREMSTGQSAVMLCGWGVKAGMAHCICGQACGWQLNLHDPSLTRAKPECFIDHVLLTIKRYTNLRLLCISIVYFRALEISNFLSTTHYSPVIVLLSLDMIIFGQDGFKSQQGRPKLEQVGLSPSATRHFTHCIHVNSA